MNSDKNSLPLWLAIFGGIVLGAMIAIIVYEFSPKSEIDIRSTLIATGRASFLLFVVPMVAAPLRTLFHNEMTVWLVAHRNLFGLAILGNQLVHLCFIVLLYRSSIDAPEPLAVLIGGIFGFLYLGAMGVLSFPRPVNRFGIARARTIHKLGFYYLVGIFFYDLVIRNLDDPSLPFWGLLFVALLIRVVAWLYSRRAPVEMA